ncbi:HD-GYP domain-containing protein [Butyrivibrio sp. VCB2001]|uniref:HD-GYP domain-containing protein n=1 Tax=Butyrivibrio sp. VCB2001 TaxID=1280667 RepID=UPI000427413E|nr:HD domain-containing phosphohydrolase [Butyrivibrio sp. VCB2001]
MMAILLLLTRFLDKRRKWALFLMEIVAFFLLWFDRLAYVYAGDVSQKGYIMVRVSNCAVFLLTSGVVFSFNIYLKNLLTDIKDRKVTTTRLNVVGIVSFFGMILAVVSAFTNIYYYFDANNRYFRGRGFLIAYIIPVICPIVQYTVIRQYKKYFSKLIYTSLVLYIFVPIACGIIQIFAYGISLVNMAMVAVSVSLYIFTYLDINDTVERAHAVELQNMQGEHKRMQRLFDQTAKAFVSAVEKKDDFTKGNAVKVAEYARKLTARCGLDEEHCEKAYYAALLHDVGLIGIPDSVIKNEEDPSKWDIEAFRQKPVIGKEILSNITEFPFLSVGAYSSHERYNGTGYPEGLKGDDIPEIARIIAVADAFVTMTTKKRYRDAKPDFVAREAFVKGAGVEFDPEFAGLMVKIIDEESSGKIHDDITLVEKELTCHTYRDFITMGIPITGKITKIRFNSSQVEDPTNAFSVPSIILFDSYDRRVHDNKKSISAYHYQEYGEIWFDDHYVSTSARMIKEIKLDDAAGYEKLGEGEYEIIAAKYDDHIKVTMRCSDYEKEDIISVMDGSTSVYIGITGENCNIRNIEIEQTDEVADETYVPRISEEISYIDHMESDIKNIQISQTRSAATDGIELKNKMRINFHAMSLPVASFIWHCPYIVIFSSDNGQVFGENYHEYALIKINGENEIKDHYSENNFTMKKKDSFPGWEDWKEQNKEGVECEVTFERKGNTIITTTENLGIYIENTTIIKENPGKVYVALTGDRVALTDIRLR